MRRARPPELRARPLRLGRVRPSSAGLGLMGGRGSPSSTAALVPSSSELGLRPGGSHSDPAWVLGDGAGCCGAGF